MIRLLLLSTSILPLVYAISVHLFLASFHERHITTLRYWRPIFIRWMYSVLIGLLAWLWIVDYNCNSKQSIANADVGSCYWDEMRSFSFFDFHFVMTMGIALMNLLISLYLIAETRRNEVDGPVPQPENSDDNKNNKPTNRILSMKNKVVLITGANAGIGLETSRQLYHRGAIVVFACRSRERAIEAMKNVDPVAKIDQSSTTVIKSDSERMYFLPLDLTSIASVRNAAKVFDEMRLRLHVLINNAGVMRQKREETVDGLEMTMAANHLGHFLLTNLLLPKLRQTALEEKYPSKVITLSSSLYTRAYRQCSNQSNAKKMQFGIDLDDLQCKHKRYTLFDQYSQSKLANILFARELGRREQSRARKLYQQQQPLHSTENDANDNHIFCPIQSYAVHPGLVRTNVVRDMPWYLYYPNIVFAIFMAVLQKTPKSGAYTSTFCAVVDDFRGEGIDMEARYYVNSEVSELSQAARSHEDSEKLWKLSRDLVKVSDE